MTLIEKPTTPAEALEQIRDNREMSRMGMVLTASAALPVAQAQEALIRELVLTAKRLHQVAVRSLDSYDDMRLSKDAIAAIARAKDAGYD